MVIDVARVAFWCTSALRWFHLVQLWCRF